MSGQFNGEADGPAVNGWELVTIEFGRLPMNMIARFAKDESGATAIEYGLIAALVSIAIIAALNLLATNLNLVFNKVALILGTAAK
jgi:pilus assembly protein Flp/PilA